jgi:hypothetical protein
VVEWLLTAQLSLSGPDIAPVCNTSRLSRSMEKEDANPSWPPASPPHPSTCTHLPTLPTFPLASVGPDVQKSLAPAECSSGCWFMRLFLQVVERLESPACCVLDSWLISLRSTCHSSGRPRFPYFLPVLCLTLMVLILNVPPAKNSCCRAQRRFCLPRHPHPFGITVATSRCLSPPASLPRRVAARFAHRLTVLYFTLDGA